MDVLRTNVYVHSEYLWVSALCVWACTYGNTLSLLLSSMGSRAKMFCSRGEAANVRWSQGECADAQFRSKSSFRAQAFLVFTEALNFTSVVCRSSSMLRGVATARYETRLTPCVCTIVSDTCAQPLLTTS